MSYNLIYEFKFGAKITWKKVALILKTRTDRQKLDNKSATILRLPK